MNQNRIAIITKSTNCFVSLQESLKENWMDVCTVSSIEAILEKYIILPFVLAIIDAKSFGKDTLKLVCRLHGARPAPILVLMTKSCANDRLELLQMGATVCLDVESSPEEQTAQAKALIQIYSARDDGLHRETLVFGTSLVINPIYRLVILDGERIDLSRREFDLLYLMARYDNRVFTPEQLYKQLWNEEDISQIGDTVKSGIKVLRKKLEPVGHEFIQNVRGIGYRFVGISENN